MGVTPARKPWTGSKYTDLLIIGESYHTIAPEYDTADVAYTIIPKVRDGEIEPRFHKAVASVVTGQAPGEFDAEEFWNSVAFWNFVQRSMKDAKEQPTGADFEDGHDRFLELIQLTLKPRPCHILVVSQRVYRSMPPFEEPMLPELPGGCRSGWPGYYKTGDDSYAIAMAIDHPAARGWKAKDWHPLVHTFLQTPSRPP